MNIFRNLLTAKFVAFLLLLAFTVSTIAQTVPLKSAKANPSLDESVTAKIDKLFAQWDKPDSPGCALGIIKDGQLIYKRGYGMANLEHNVPISSKSVFDIMSMDKQFVGMSILLLARQGKLSLDDEIQKYLPEIPRYQSPITLRHLIHHTSGIRNYVELAELAGMRGENVHLTDDDYLGLIARQKELNFKPGEEHSYSNSGYFLLGLIVKRVSGKTLREFAEENIFKPLGMNNTQFVDNRNLVLKNRVTAYLPNINGGFSAALIAGWVGVYTSVEDLFLWDQNFYNNKLGGGADLISEQLSTGTLNNGEKTKYAFGLRFGEYKGLKTVGHGGGGGGFTSGMRQFPEHKFSIICLCNENSIPDGQLSSQVADIFLADQFKKVPEPIKETATVALPIISIPEKELASFTGTYFDPLRAVLHRFYLKDGNLMIQPSFKTEPVYVLSPLSKNRFKVVGAPVEIVFVKPVSGGPMQEQSIFGGHTWTFDRVQGVPSSIQLAEFTGKYVSDDLAGATYTLSVKDGKLIVQIRNGITVFSDRALVLAFAQSGASETPKDNLLTPAFTDVFFTFVDGDRVIVRFTRNQQSAISGFTLSTETNRRLRFNKQ